MFDYGRPRKIRPMLANKGDKSLLNDGDYIAQTKYDGTGIILIKNGQEIKLMTARNWKNDVAIRFIEIVTQARNIRTNCGVFHAELTFYDKNGREHFLTALATSETKRGYVAMLEVHDILYSNNQDVWRMPYIQRFNLVERFVPKQSHIRPASTATTNKVAFWQQAMKEGREGIMLKFAQSPYEEGIRSNACLKLKKIYTENADTADVIIAGVTRGYGKWKNLFGSLILAQYDKSGKLQYVGKTSGMDDSTRMRLFSKLSKLKSFSPISRSARQPNDVLFYVRPKEVVEIRFLQKPANGSFRMPAFVKERPDKPAAQCLL